MASAPPFVVYSSCTEVVVAAESWDDLYASLQALKGHVQEYPGCQSFDVFVRPEADGMRVHCYTNWDTPAQLEAFLERGYTFDRLLADIDAPDPERSLVMEKIF